MVGSNTARWPSSSPCGSPSGQFRSFWRCPRSRRLGECRGSASLRPIQFVRDVRALFHSDCHAVWFLLASALYRDGLVAIFSFGAVLAVSVYGLSAADVVIFGVAANVVAALGAGGAGIIEDRIGPKPVILGLLAALVTTSVVLLFAHGSTMFWIFGLLLCLWVGPAESSSRTYVVRLAPAGREGEMFGLDATTGRAVSFLAPGLFALFSGIFASPRMGIIGIVLVLLGGRLALSRVEPPPSSPPVLDESSVA